MSRIGNCGDEGGEVELRPSLGLWQSADTYFQGLASGVGPPALNESSVFMAPRMAEMGGRLARVMSRGGKIVVAIANEEEEMVVDEAKALSCCCDCELMMSRVWAGLELRERARCWLQTKCALFLYEQNGG